MLYLIFKAQFIYKFFQNSWLFSSQSNENAILMVYYYTIILTVLRVNNGGYSQCNLAQSLTLFPLKCSNKGHFRHCYWGCSVLNRECKPAYLINLIKCPLWSCPMTKPLEEVREARYLGKKQSSAQRWPLILR